MQGRKSFIARILRVGIVGVLATLVIGEIALRIGSTFVHDKSGPGWRPGSRLHVLAVGDSHTYGGTVAATETYPAQLSAFLDEAQPGEYSVLNLGVPGMNTAQLRNRLAVNLSRWSPDVVIVWCGTNNAWNAAEEESGGLLRRLDALALRLKVYKLIRVLLNDRTLNLEAEQRIADQRVKLVTVNMGTHRDPFDGEIRNEKRGADKVDDEALRATVDDYDAMVTMAQAAGAKILFITYPLEVRGSAIANRAAREVGARRGVPVVEGLPGHLRVPGEENRYTWALHPSAPVYREIARDVAAAVLAAAPAASPTPAESGGAGRASGGAQPVLPDVR
jgi:hypothetical protein